MPAAAPTTAGGALQGRADHRAQWRARRHRGGSGGMNQCLQRAMQSLDQQLYFSDREAFAKRLIDLYSGEEESSQEQPIFAKGEIAVGTTEHYPAERVNIFSIQKNARLYAHVKLDDSASLLSEVFIKWERISDNKLLLFEKKNVQCI